MALVPLEGEVNTGTSTALTLTDRQIQQTGIRLGLVKKRDLVQEINTYGEITYDERQIYRLTSWVAGRVERLEKNFVGEEIKKGELLAMIYSPSLIQSIEEFGEAKKALLQFLKNKSVNKNGDVTRSQEMLNASRVLLMRKGLSKTQVALIESTIEEDKNPLGKDVIPLLAIRAKHSGTIIKKCIEEGSYVKEGTELLKVSDLSSLWIYGEVYEYELSFVSRGDQVLVTTRSYPGEEFKGKVDFIEPVVQSRTRTVRIRINLSNKDKKLKPGMFADLR